MKITSKILKNKVGRPKTTVKERIEEKHFDLEAIRLIAIHGLTDAELGEILKVDERTINRWKTDPEFLSVLNKGKLESDLEMVKSLYKRGLGFEYEEIAQEGKPETDSKTGEIKIKISFIKKTKKYFPPDTAAAFIWLKNRRSTEWKDRKESGPEREIEIPQNVDGLDKTQVNELFEKLRNRK